MTKPASDRLDAYFDYIASISPPALRAWTATDEAAFCEAVEDAVHAALLQIEAGARSASTGSRPSGAGPRASPTTCCANRPTEHPRNPARPGDSRSPGSVAVAPLGRADPGGRVETPHRRKLPDTRQSITHRFEVGGMHGYITVGLYPDGAPGEVFVKMAKEGSTLSGLLDGWAITTSIALQYGVPLIAIVHKLARTRFEPSGFTGVEGIGYASSVLDYIARWMAMRFLGDLRASLPPGEGPPCPNCGAAMVRGDGAWECVDCGQKMPG